MKDLKAHIDALQEQNSDLQSQLEVKQKQLENSDVEKKQYIRKYRELKDKRRCDIAIQTDMVGTRVGVTALQL